MQSKMRAFKRGHMDAFGLVVPKHKTTKNRKGQRYVMQTIVLHAIASDANQKCVKTIVREREK